MARSKGPMPADAVQAIMADQQFQQALVQLAADTERPVELVRAEARAALTDMSTVNNPLWFDTNTLFPRMIDRYGFRGRITYDRAQISEIRHLLTRYPGALLPNHRSYADPAVLRAVLAENHFPPHITVGGVNMRFWPLSLFAQRSGNLFIRRRIQDDPVYKLALRRYLAHLVGRRSIFEWYIEGGRSRTGKMLPPKLGILSYIADTVADGACDDFMLVPLSVVWDEVRDVEDHARFSQGATKKPESLPWMVNYIREVRDRYAQVQVHLGVGEPVSLRAMLEAEEDRRMALNKAAFEVCVRINRATPVTPTSLLALILLSTDRALTTAQLRVALGDLIDVVERRGLSATNLSLRHNAQIEAALRPLMRHRIVVRNDEGPESVYLIPTAQRLAASWYRNSIIHFFVTGAIVELSLLRHDGEEGFVADADALRDLLKFEFFFSGRDEFHREVLEELELHDPDWRAHPDDGEILARIVPLMAHCVLGPFLDAYLVVAKVLADHGDQAGGTTDSLVAEAEANARQYLMQRLIFSAESNSTVVFATALQLAGHRDLIDAGPDVAVRRKAFVAELEEWTRRIGLLRQMHQQRIDERVAEENGRARRRSTGRARIRRRAQPRPDDQPEGHNS